MLSLSKVYYNDIDPAVLERLYNEAYPYISEERRRLGEDKLRAFLLEDFGNFPIIKYDVDGYTVGVCSYGEIKYNDIPYLFHRHPIYGSDQNGSRSWWYSEDFQKNNSEFVKSEGFKGVVTLFNPNSPAGRAVGSHFGSFGKYYDTPVIVEPSVLNFRLNPDADGILKAYVINLKK